MTPLPPIKFLLVDDLEANLLALTGLLKREGLELLTASSGPEALELLLVHDIALALLDVQMPGMGGFELAELMRGTERTRKVPIIFLTAGAVDPQRRIRGYETGAVDFLAKPIEPHNLLNKAATFFELARQRQALAQSNAMLAEADRRKDEFLAMLAHELRNPLAPLRNAAEILRAPAADPAARQRAMELIARQIDNMSRMIDDLLDVSRISEGKVELRKEPVALDTILHAAAEAARYTCAANGQELTLSLPSERVLVLADSTRLEQIFGNLLGNACKYSGQGSHISIVAELQGGRDAQEAVIHVRDDGIGIDPELLPHVFDLFVQASRTLDRAHGGLGIGLTLVHRLVRLHGGSVKARSDGNGKGTEFTVRLPVFEACMVSAGGMDELADEDKPIRLLIVDDNLDAAESMAMVQQLRGHTTRVVHSGAEALAAAEEFSPQAVLLDIGLPGMDGYEVARRLRKMEWPVRPFLVALTGYGNEEDRERALAAGFDEHLVKPADLELLREWLRTRV